jgi:hypothetical protein
MMDSQLKGLLGGDENLKRWGLVGGSTLLETYLLFLPGPAWTVIPPIYVSPQSWDDTCAIIPTFIG